MRRSEQTGKKPEIGPVDHGYGGRKNPKVEMVGTDLRSEDRLIASEGTQMEEKGEETRGGTC